MLGQFGAPPNTNVCPVCLGLPGALPVLNRKAVEYAVRAAMALNCQIRETSIFARKNYFYPDLPKGYQISQYDKPLAEHGYIEITTRRMEPRTNRHHARPSGRRRRQEHPRRFSRFGDHYTYIDLNRSGVPLIEIVSEPDMRSPDEAYEYLTRLKEIILYTGVSDCNMEEGSLRCDANVSMRPRGRKKFGTKAEVKNVNSFRFIRDALEYEIERQIEVVESGGQVVQETRLYNSDEGKTYSMRSKEQAHDYRYFPEPDLLPLVVDAEMAGRDSRALAGAARSPPRAHGRRNTASPTYDAACVDRYARTGRSVRGSGECGKESKTGRQPGAERNHGTPQSQGLDIEQSPISMKGVAHVGRFG